MWSCLTDFNKKISNIKFDEIHSVGNEELNAKDRADMTTLTAHFSATHANVPISVIPLLLLFSVLLS
jgi:hypothetical protein